MSASYTVDAPQELLTFLFARCGETKRTTVRQWLKHGRVHVNGRSATRRDHPLETGDVVSIGTKSDSVAQSRLSRGMTIVFEDASLIVIEKPERLLSIASETERERTAYASLTDYVRRGDPRSPERIWIVHRLDRETSGLMIFARSEAAKRTLQQNWFKADKKYLAIVEGAPPKQQGEFESDLDETGPFKVYSRPPSGRTRRAVTRYRVVKRMRTTTLVELTLETGRRNQIRVHLADAECPIVGDTKYEARTNPARRLALHSSGLELKHPVTGELLQFESPLPHSLARLL